MQINTQNLMKIKAKKKAFNLKIWYINYSKSSDNYMPDPLYQSVIIIGLLSFLNEKK
jgi:hypothetical protein